MMTVFISNYFLFRMNTTLIEFTDMKWQRGDISFLFNGLKTGL